MQSANQDPIAILGAGSWGTALALYLSRLGQPVRLWSYQTSHVTEMLNDRINNRYMKGHPFPDELQPTPELNDAIHQVKDILIAVPSIGFRDTLEKLKPLLQPDARIVWVTKGLDIKTGALLHDVALDILGKQHPCAILSGPSFATEVAAGLPTAVVAATESQAFANDLVARFNSQRFRVYTSTDIVGVEIGGIVKNILAIATGISDGMAFGANARSALITRGMAEMVRLGIALGGKHETFLGLAGLGDLVLTCTDNLSRNRRFGIALGQGKTPEEAQNEIQQVVEGKRNAEMVVRLAKQHRVEMPITEAVWNILNGKLTPMTAMQALLSREPKQE